MKNKKKASLILLCVLICLTFTGCFDAREIDDIGYVLALGIDAGKTNTYKLTFQFALPVSSGSEGQSQNRKSAIAVAEASTMYAAFNLLNTSISKQIDMSHAKAVIFSKEIAKSPEFAAVMNTISRGHEFRPNVHVLIADSAEDYIRSVEPQLVLDAAKYYELIFRGYEYTGFSQDSRFFHFFFDFVSSSIQPVAALVGTGKYENSKEFNTSGSTYPEKGEEKPLGGDYKAGDIPELRSVKAQQMGIAVFKDGKMVGELDGIETTSYLMLSGHYKNSYVTIPHKTTKTTHYDAFKIKEARRPEVSVDILGEAPTVNIKVNLEADILSAVEGEHFETPDQIPYLEKNAEQYLKKQMLLLLEKTTEQFDSDICGFGRKVRGKFLTFEQWEKYNWFQKYKNAKFNVDVILKIRRTGLVIDTK